MSTRYIFLSLFLFVTYVSTPRASEQFVDDRHALIEIIKSEVKETQSALKKTELNKSTIEALMIVPRHESVPKNQREFAYENRPLSIGFGQTISQPYIVAIMTNLLNLNSRHTVLAVGTGSGYQVIFDIT